MSAKKKFNIAPLIISTSEQLNKLWDDTWKAYIPILNEYYNINELISANGDNKKLDICNPITLDDSTYMAKGASKYIEKCECEPMQCDNKIYAVNRKETSIEELKNHLDILVLYYKYKDKWLFKIPNIYYRKITDYKNL